jgi:hypothetical protein
MGVGIDKYEWQDDDDESEPNKNVHDGFHGMKPQ